MKTQIMYKGVNARSFAIKVIAIANVQSGNPNSQSGIPSIKSVVSSGLSVITV